MTPRDINTALNMKSSGIHTVADAVVRSDVPSYGQVLDLAGGGGLQWNETPSGAVDSSNATFVLNYAPAAGKLMLFRNGLLLRVGSTADYTITGDTITFNAGNLPHTDDILLATYATA